MATLSATYLVSVSVFLPLVDDAVAITQWSRSLRQVRMDARRYRGGRMLTVTASSSSSSSSRQVEAEEVGERLRSKRRDGGGGVHVKMAPCGSEGGQRAVVLV